MWTQVIILIAAILLAHSSPVPEDGVVVDQRQSGELNVQVNVKDVEIIALLSGGREQYTDYDYNYDYAEMTVKPPNNSSTASHSNTTSHNSSEVSNQPSEMTTQKIIEITPPNKDPVPSPTLDVENSSSIPSIPIIEGNNSVKISNSEESSNASTAATPASSAEIKIEEPSSTAVSAVTEAALAEKGCRKGFHRNKKGDCELKLKPNSTNALLKLVELSQKLKLRRAN